MKIDRTKSLQKYETIINWMILYTFILLIYFMENIRLLVFLFWTLYSTIYIVYFILNKKSFLVNLNSQNTYSKAHFFITSLFDQGFLILIYFYIFSGSIIEIIGNSFTPFSKFVDKEKSISILFSDIMFFYVFCILFVSVFIIDIFLLLLDKPSLSKRLSYKHYLE
jgi:hypothetical protein